MSALPAPLHPGAWWAWAGALAATALQTTNLATLAMLCFVVTTVVIACRTPMPTGRSYAMFVRVAVFIIVIRMVLQVLFGPRGPGHVLFDVPAIALPTWASGVTVGGPVTLEATLAAFSQGLRLAVVLAVFGAVNSVTSPYRLLRIVPTVLYEAGVAVTVAMSTAPQAVIAAGRIQQARRLRGRPSRGIRSLRHLAVPLLEQSLERSVELAASMDARGFGRRDAVSPKRRVFAASALGVGLIASCIGVYGLLSPGTPAALGVPTVLVGAAALVISLQIGRSATTRTHHRPDRWDARAWAVTGAGVAPLVAMTWLGRLHPLLAEPPAQPLAMPSVSIPLVIAIGAAMVPAFVCPDESQR